MSQRCDGCGREWFPAPSEVQSANELAVLRVEVGDREDERDAARREVAEVQAREVTLWQALRAIVNACEDAFESPAEAESWAQKGDMQGYIDAAVAVLANSPGGGRELDPPKEDR